MANDDRVQHPDDAHDACREQIEALTSRITELEGKWKRALADLANQEKEHTRSSEESRTFANASLIRSLLPLIDAIRAAAGASHDLDALVKLADDFLRQHGVHRIPTTGVPADYLLHEVVSQRTDAAAKPGVVLEEVLAGYTMHGQCLRAARVIVCAEATDGDASTSKDQE